MTERHLSTISSSSVMTSREIAQLTGKQHKNVLRDIDNLLKTLSSELSTGFSMTYEGDPAHGYRVFILDRDATYCLVSGYDANARMRIIKRWQELEVQAPQIPNFNNPAEAARAWAEQYDRAEQEKLEKEAARQKALEAQPMVQFHEEVTQADAELNIDETCAVLFNGSVKPKELRAWLKTQHWMDARPGMNKPTAWAMTQGLMRLRLSPPSNGRVFEVPVMTGKGIALLRHLHRNNELFINAIPMERRLAAPDYPV